MTQDLSPARRSELRSEAHKLKPTVLIGDRGLTDEVVAEIDRTLKAHGLIKVRAATDDRKARDAWLKDICERLEAHPVQQIGKVFVLFRENPEESAAKGPRGAATEKPEGRARPRGEVVSERGKMRQRSRDLDKHREADVRDMVRKGKIKPKVESRSAGGARDADAPPEEGSTRTSRPRSRTPAPRPESGPRRRPRSTSR